MRRGAGGTPPFVYATRPAPIVSKGLNRPWSLTAATLVLAATVSGARAQRINDVFQEPSVFDLVLGAHALEQPASQFIEFACGTDGGPRGRVLEGFYEYARCLQEPSGLREVTFRYDDEAEYIARARSQDYQISLFGGTTIYAIAVIVSGLFDELGILQGLRVVSDPLIPVAEREMAYTLGRFLKARYGLVEGDCEGLPHMPGETPVGLIFIKEACHKILAAGESVYVETHHYRRPGQTALGIARIQTNEGQFWSEVRLEVIRASDPVADAATAARAATIELRTAERDALIARAMNCPGCDLSGIDLKRADLTNANLRGANLAGANLHGATVAGADLAGANFARANLNRADFRRADLSGADLTLAMAYAGRFEGADLAGANLEGGFMAEAQFTLANLTDARLFYADLRRARFADATLVRADMTQTWLDEAVFFRARMNGTLLNGALLVNAQLRGAVLVGASLVDADLYRADFGEADLTNADLRRARLTATGFRNAVLTGTIFQ